VATTRVTLTVAAVLTLGLSPGAAQAIDTPNERITLVGLTGVHVVLDELGEDAERKGLDRASLQAEVHQRLTRAGLRVLSATEALVSVGRPTLHLRVIVRRGQDAPDSYVYSVDLSLRQHVRLVRDRTLESYAVTWSEHRTVGTVAGDGLGLVRAILLQKVDEFVTAWRVSNLERY
jgi:hypothetical protein